MRASVDLVQGCFEEIGQFLGNAACDGWGGRWRGRHFRLWPLRRYLGRFSPTTTSGCAARSTSAGSVNVCQQDRHSILGFIPRAPVALGSRSDQKFAIGIESSNLS